VKHIWDSDDIFHSRFTVPPLLLADEQAVHCSYSDDESIDIDLMDMEEIPIAQPIY